MKLGKRKKELVPFDQAQRVIHLYNRSKRRQVSYPVWGTVFIIIGILCILYCLGISIYGFGTYFFLIWDVIGLVCIGLGYLLKSESMLSAIPLWLKRAFVVVACAGLLLFCIVEGMILSKFASQPPMGADYCVILGAQWKSTGPSEVLRRRLDAAVEYLSENPDTKVIVSGGQGANEDITEAAGMREYLLEAGIDAGRILVEDASTNTYENLVFSGNILDREQDSVVLVTNNFHVFRAMKIAQKQGYEYVYGLSASSVAGLLPNNMLREFVGVLKDFFMGNL